MIHSRAASRFIASASRSTPFPTPTTSLYRTQFRSASSSSRNRPDLELLMVTLKARAELHTDCIEAAQHLQERRIKPHVFAFGFTGNLRFWGTAEMTVTFWTFAEGHPTLMLRANHGESDKELRQKFGEEFDPVPNPLLLGYGPGIHYETAYDYSYTAEEAVSRLRYVAGVFLHQLAKVPNGHVMCQSINFEADFDGDRKDGRRAHILRHLESRVVRKSRLLLINEEDDADGDDGDDDDDNDDDDDDGNDGTEKMLFESVEAWREHQKKLDPL